MGAIVAAQGLDGMGLDRHLYNWINKNYNTIVMWGDAVVTVVAAVVLTIVSFGSSAPAAWSTAWFALSAAVGVATAAATNVTMQAINNDKTGKTDIDWHSVGTSAAIGGITGVATACAGQGISLALKGLGVGGSAAANATANAVADQTANAAATAATAGTAAGIGYAAVYAAVYASLTTAATTVWSVIANVALQAGASALVNMAVNVATQLITTGKVDWHQVAVTGLSTFVTTAAVAGIGDAVRGIFNLSQSHLSQSQLSTDLNYVVKTPVFQTLKFVMAAVKTYYSQHNEDMGWGWQALNDAISVTNSADVYEQDVTNDMGINADKTNANGLATPGMSFNLVIQGAITANDIDSAFMGRHAFGAMQIESSLGAVYAGVQDISQHAATGYTKSYTMFNQMSDASGIVSGLCSAAETGIEERTAYNMFGEDLGSLTRAQNSAVYAKAFNSEPMFSDLIAVGSMENMLTATVNFSLGLSKALSSNSSNSPMYSGLVLNLESASGNLMDNPVTAVGALLQSIGTYVSFVGNVYGDGVTMAGALNHDLTQVNEGSSISGTFDIVSDIANASGSLVESLYHPLTTNNQANMNKVQKLLRNDPNNTNIDDSNPNNTGYSMAALTEALKFSGVDNVSQFIADNFTLDDNGYYYANNGSAVTVNYSSDGSVSSIIIHGTGDSYIDSTGQNINGKFYTILQFKTDPSSGEITPVSTVYVEKGSTLNDGSANITVKTGLVEVMSNGSLASVTFDGTNFIEGGDASFSIDPVKGSGEFTVNLSAVNGTTFDYSAVKAGDKYLVNSAYLPNSQVQNLDGALIPFTATNDDSGKMYLVYQGSKSADDVETYDNTNDEDLSDVYIQLSSNDFYVTGTINKQVLSSGGVPESITQTFNNVQYTLTANTVNTGAPAAPLFTAPSGNDGLNNIQMDQDVDNNSDVLAPQTITDAPIINLATPSNSVAPATWQYDSSSQPSDGTPPITTMYNFSAAKGITYTINTQTTYDSGSKSLKTTLVDTSLPNSTDANQPSQAAEFKLSNGQTCAVVVQTSADGSVKDVAADNLGSFATSNVQFNNNTNTIVIQTDAGAITENISTNSTNYTANYNGQNYNYTPLSSFGINNMGIITNNGVGATLVTINSDGTLNSNYDTDTVNDSLASSGWQMSDPDGNAIFSKTSGNSITSICLNDANNNACGIVEKISSYDSTNSAQVTSTYGLDSFGAFSTLLTQLSVADSGARTTTILGVNASDSSTIVPGTTMTIADYISAQNQNFGNVKNLVDYKFNTTTTEGNTVQLCQQYYDNTIQPSAAVTSTANTTTGSQYNDTLNSVTNQPSVTLTTNNGNFVTTLADGVDKILVPQVWAESCSNISVSIDNQQIIYFSNTGNPLIGGAMTIQAIYNNSDGIATFSTLEDNGTLANVTTLSDNGDNTTKVNVTFYDANVPSYLGYYSDTNGAEMTCIIDAKGNRTDFTSTVPGTESDSRVPGGEFYQNTYSSNGQAIVNVFGNDENGNYYSYEAFNNGSYFQRIIQAPDGTYYGVNVQQYDNAAVDALNQLSLSLGFSGNLFTTQQSVLKISLNHTGSDAVDISNPFTTTQVDGTYNAQTGDFTLATPDTITTQYAITETTGFNTISDSFQMSDNTPGWSFTSVLVNGAWMPVASQASANIDGQSGFVLGVTNGTQTDGSPLVELMKFEQLDGAGYIQLGDKINNLTVTNITSNGDIFLDAPDGSPLKVGFGQNANTITGSVTQLELEIGDNNQIVFAVQDCLNENENGLSVTYNGKGGFTLVNATVVFDNQGNLVVSSGLLETNGINTSVQPGQAGTGGTAQDVQSKGVFKAVLDSNKQLVWQVSGNSQISIINGQMVVLGNGTEFETGSTLANGQVVNQGNVIAKANGNDFVYVSDGDYAQTSYTIPGNKGTEYVDYDANGVTDAYIIVTKGNVYGNQNILVTSGYCIEGYFQLSQVTDDDGDVISIVNKAGALIPDSGVQSKDFNADASNTSYAAKDSVTGESGTLESVKINGQIVWSFNGQAISGDTNHAYIIGNDIVGYNVVVFQKNNDTNAPLLTPPPAKFLSIFNTNVVSVADDGSITIGGQGVVLSGAQATMVEMPGTDITGTIDINSDGSINNMLTQVYLNTTGNQPTPLLWDSKNNDWKAINSPVFQENFDASVDSILTPQTVSFKIDSLSANFSQATIDLNVNDMEIYGLGHEQQQIGGGAGAGTSTNKMIWDVTLSGNDDGTWNLQQTNNTKGCVVVANIQFNQFVSGDLTEITLTGNCFKAGTQLTIDTTNGPVQTSALITRTDNDGNIYTFDCQYTIDQGGTIDFKQDGGLVDNLSQLKNTKIDISVQESEDGWVISTYVEHYSNVGEGSMNADGEPISAGTTVTFTNAYTDKQGNMVDTGKPIDVSNIDIGNSKYINVSSLNFSDGTYFWGALETGAERLSAGIAAYVASAIASTVGAFDYAQQLAVAATNILKGNVQVGDIFKNGALNSDLFDTNNLTAKDYFLAGVTAVGTAVAVAAFTVSVVLTGGATAALAGLIVNGILTGVALGSTMYSLGTGDLQGAAISAAFSAVGALAGPGGLLKTLQIGAVAAVPTVPFELSATAEWVSIGLRGASAAIMAGAGGVQIVQGIQNNWDWGQIGGGLLEVGLGAAFMFGGGSWSTGYAVGGSTFTTMATSSVRLLAASAIVWGDQIISYVSDGDQFVASALTTVKNLLVAVVVSNTLLSFIGTIAGATSFGNVINSFNDWVSSGIGARCANALNLGLSFGITGTIFFPLNAYVSGQPIDLSFSGLAWDFVGGFVFGLGAGLIGGSEVSAAWLNNMGKAFTEASTAGFNLLGTIQSGAYLGYANVMGLGDLMTLIPSFQDGTLNWTPHFLTMQERTQSFISGFTMGMVLMPWFSASMPAEAITSETMGYASRYIADAAYMNPLIDAFGGAGSALGDFVHMAATVSQYSIVSNLGKAVGYGAGWCLDQTGMDSWLGTYTTTNADGNTITVPNTMANILGTYLSDISFFLVPSRSTNALDALTTGMKVDAVTTMDGDVVTMQDFLDANDNGSGLKLSVTENIPGGSEYEREIFLDAGTLNKLIDSGSLNIMFLTSPAIGPLVSAFITLEEPDQTVRYTDEAILGNPETESVSPEDAGASPESVNPAVAVRDLFANTIFDELARNNGQSSDALENAFGEGFNWKPILNAYNTAGMTDEAKIDAIKNALASAGGSGMVDVSDISGLVAKSIVESGSPEDVKAFVELVNEALGTDINADKVENIMKSGSSNEKIIAGIKDLIENPETTFGDILAGGIFYNRSQIGLDGDPLKIIQDKLGIEFSAEDINKIKDLLKDPNITQDEAIEQIQKIIGDNINTADKAVSKEFLLQYRNAAAELIRQEADLSEVNGKKLSKMNENPGDYAVIDVNECTVRVDARLFADAVKLELDARNNKIYMDFKARYGELNNAKQLSKALSQMPLDKNEIEEQSQVQKTLEGMNKQYEAAGEKVVDQDSYINLRNGIIKDLLGKLDPVEMAKLLEQLKAEGGCDAILTERIKSLTDAAIVNAIPGRDQPADQKKFFDSLKLGESLGIVKIEGQDIDVSMYMCAHAVFGDAWEKANSTKTIKDKMNAIQTLFEASRNVAISEYASTEKVLSNIQLKAYDKVNTEGISKLANSIKTNNGKFSDKAIADLQEIMREFAVLGTGEGKTVLIAGLAPVFKFLNDNIGDGKVSIMLADNNINVNNLANEMKRIFGNGIEGLETYTFRNDEENSSKELEQAIEDGKIILTSYGDLSFRYVADKEAENSLLKGKMGVLLMDEADMALFMPMSMISQWSGVEQGARLEFLKSLQEGGTRYDAFNKAQEELMSFLIEKEGKDSYLENCRTALESLKNVEDLLKAGNIEEALRILKDTPLAKELESFKSSITEDYETTLNDRAKTLETIQGQKAIDDYIAATEKFKENYKQFKNTIENLDKLNADQNVTAKQLLRLTGIITQGFEIGQTNRLKTYFGENGDGRTKAQDLLKEMTKKYTPEELDTFKNIVDIKDPDKVHEGYELTKIMENMLISQMTWVRGVDYELKDGKVLLIMNGKAMPLMPEAGLLQGIEALERANGNKVDYSMVAPKEYTGVSIKEAVSDAAGAVGFSGTYSMAIKNEMGFKSLETGGQTEVTLNADGTGCKANKPGVGDIPIDCDVSDGILSAYSDLVVDALMPDKMLIAGFKSQASMDMAKDIFKTFDLRDGRIAEFGSTTDADDASKWAKNESGTYNTYFGVYEQIGRGIDMKPPSDVSSVSLYGVDIQLSYASAIAQFVGRILGARMADKMNRYGNGFLKIDAKFITSKNTIDANAGEIEKTINPNNEQWTKKMYTTLIWDRAMFAKAEEDVIAQSVGKGVNSVASREVERTEMPQVVAALEGMGLTVEQTNALIADFIDNGYGYNQSDGTTNLSNRGMAAAVAMLTLLGLNSASPSLEPMPGSQQQKQIEALQSAVEGLGLMNYGIQSDFDILLKGDSKITNAKARASFAIVNYLMQQNVINLTSGEGISISDLIQMGMLDISESIANPENLSPSELVKNTLKNYSANGLNGMPIQLKLPVLNKYFRAQQTLTNARKAVKKIYTKAQTNKNASWFEKFWLQKITYNLALREQNRALKSLEAERADALAKALKIQDENMKKIVLMILNMQETAGGRFKFGSAFNTSMFMSQINDKGIFSFLSSGKFNLKTAGAANLFSFFNLAQKTQIDVLQKGYMSGFEKFVAGARNLLKMPAAQGSIEQRLGDLKNKGVSNKGLLNLVNPVLLKIFSDDEITEFKASNATELLNSVEAAITTKIIPDVINTDSPDLKQRVKGLNAIASINGQLSTESQDALMTIANTQAYNMEVRKSAVDTLAVLAEKAIENAGKKSGDQAGTDSLMTTLGAIANGTVITGENSGKKYIAMDEKAVEKNKALKDAITLAKYANSLILNIGNNELNSQAATRPELKGMGINALKFGLSVGRPGNDLWRADRAYHWGCSKHSSYNDEQKWPKSECSKRESGYKSKASKGFASTCDRRCGFADRLLCARAFYGVANCGGVNPHYYNAVGNKLSSYGNEGFTGRGAGHWFNIRFYRW